MGTDKYISEKNMCKSQNQIYCLKLNMKLNIISDTSEFCYCMYVCMLYLYVYMNMYNVPELQQHYINNSYYYYI